MVIRTALLCAMILGCQDIRAVGSDSGMDASGDSGGFGGKSGLDGGSGGSGGGGHPQLSGSVPVDTCPNSMKVQVSLANTGLVTPYLREDILQINYTAPPGAAISFRSDIGGTVTPRDGVVYFNISATDEVLWTGMQTFTVVAEMRDCVSTGSIELEFAGDLIFGTRTGTLLYVTNDGRRLKIAQTLGADSDHEITAILPIRPERFVVAKEAGSEVEILFVGEAGNPAFSTTDFQSERLFSEPPNTIIWDEANQRYLTDGGDEQLIIFNGQGQYIESIPLGASGISQHLLLIDDTLFTSVGSNIYSLPLIDPPANSHVFYNGTENMTGLAQAVTGDDVVFSDGEKLYQFSKTGTERNQAPQNVRYFIPLGRRYLIKPILNRMLTVNSDFLGEQDFLQDTLDDTITAFAWLD